LPEPRVVIEVMLCQLSDVFFRAAVIFRRDVGQLCLKFRTEIHFHEARLGGEVATVKCHRANVRRGSNFPAPPNPRRIGHPPLTSNPLLTATKVPS
jgi:hypothetical protein